MPVADFPGEENLSLSTTDNGTPQMTLEDLGHLIAHGSYQEAFEAFNHLYNQERSTEHNVTELLSPGLPIRRTRRRLNN